MTQCILCNKALESNGTILLNGTKVLYKCPDCGQYIIDQQSSFFKRIAMPPSTQPFNTEEILNMLQKIVQANGKVNPVNFPFT